MEEDVTLALQDLHRIPVKLYKGMVTIIASPLLEIIKEARKKGCLPADQKAATIIVIHKEGRPAEACFLYRPISLLNLEAKVLAKVLANKLRGVIGSLVHLDKSGFMPDRSTRLKLLRLFGVLHLTAGPETVQAALMALDAKMAYDSLEWNYMFAVQEHLGFEEKSDHPTGKT
ncbi:hypothetical protein NDU88_001988 [Pleurodeles waltl]|uniref:Reverse transcriptase domain-containing protein n=1 Tax=Pleurodeles waltl TaxID=8319 RepID=A0AAV7T0R9_PLEWA|nr:hypothetical protein NDU88_001988 [Pleurodeles waltl]